MADEEPCYGLSHLLPASTDSAPEASPYLSAVPQRGQASLHLRVFSLCFPWSEMFLAEISAWLLLLSSFKSPFKAHFLRKPSLISPSHPIIWLSSLAWGPPHFLVHGSGVETQPSHPLSTNPFEQLSCLCLSYCLLPQWHVPSLRAQMKSSSPLYPQSLGECQQMSGARSIFRKWIKTRANLDLEKFIFCCL